MVGENDFITIDDAVDYTGLSRSTLDRYCGYDRTDPRHLTKFVRGMRRRVYFDKSELDNVMSYLNDIRPSEEE